METKELHTPERRGTVFSGYTVMTKAMMGSGLLTIAFTCAQSGIILGLIMLVIAAVLTWVSLHALSELAISYGEKEVTFFSMNSHIFPRMKWFLDVAIIVDCVGGAICFIQVTGTHLAEGFVEIFGAGSLPKSSIIIILECAVVCALFPLTMVKEITATKVVNLIGIASLVYVACLAIAYTDLNHITSDLLYPMDAAKAIGAFPILLFAFSCQQNILDVSNEMKDPSLKRMDVVTVASVLTGCLIYLPVMLLPVLTFGRPEKIPDTFMGLLPVSDIAVIIGFFCAAITVGTSYVLIVRPIRSSAISMIYGEDRPRGAKEFQVRLVSTILISLVVLGAAIGIGDNLSKALSFTGLLGANSCGFVMPFAMYLGRFGWAPKTLMRATVLGMLVFCLALYPVGIAANIMDIING